MSPKPEFSGGGVGVGATENDIAPVLTISRRFVLAGTTTLLSTSSVGKWKDSTDGVSAGTCGSASCAPVKKGSTAENT